MSKNVVLLDLYNSNKDFKAYVDKYAKVHGKLFPEDCFFDDEVLQHAMVKNYAEYLEKREAE